MTTFVRNSIKASKTGGSEVLEYIKNETMDLSTLAPRQVVVKHRFAGINFIDTYFRSGLYPLPQTKKFPFILGNEGSGVVVHCGKELPKALVGTRCCFFSSFEGGYTTHSKQNFDDLIFLCDKKENITKLFNEEEEQENNNTENSTENIVVAPSALSDKEACAMLINGLTAHYLTDSCYHVTPKTEFVLVNAASGGTGLMISQISKLRGARNVISVCGSPEKQLLAKNVGKADMTINYKETTDWVSEVKKISSSAGGIDVLYDAVGKSTFEANAMSVLRRRGSLVTFGNASGAVPALQPLELSKHGSITLQRPKLFDFVDRKSGELQERVTELSSWILDKKLTLTIPHEYKLEEAKIAHDLLEAGRTTGKIVLDCQ